MTGNYSEIIGDQIFIPKALMLNYQKLGINEHQLVLLLFIHISQTAGIQFPTPEQLAEKMSISTEECSKHLRKLIQLGYLEIEEDDTGGVLKEMYSLETLWHKIYAGGNQETSTEEVQIGEMFRRFEQEFGRPLSPFEIERINQWLDEEKYSIDLVYAALREAVLMSKLNFTYIDRILIDWKKKGVRSLDQAKQTSKSFHEFQKSEPKQDNSHRKKLYYNWLEE
ncbi:DNA replication protein [Gracilibacillus ureilyticus]|uniref:DNA replication protein n=1 Tax=Gracilibacillus ureilyticus TaxID=531814 RepID=A0A1H9LLY1_9BACI|nr:DnaD domain-containing protein [Gracilibacillus ureilyticus]SER12420.1 DNA replication protein [Gracilibacillus ureilyticus]